MDHSDHSGDKNGSPLKGKRATDEDSSTFTREDTNSITITITESDGDYSDSEYQISPTLVDQGQNSTSSQRRAPDNARLMRENARLGSKLRSSQQTVSLLVARLEKSEKTLELALRRIGDLESGKSPSASPLDHFARSSGNHPAEASPGKDADGRVKYSTPPPDQKEVVRLTLRGLGKDVKVPFSFKMMKVAAKILADSPVRCKAEDVTVVVLRKEPHRVMEVGSFMGDLLGWRLWEAGVLAGDIVHVIAQLPPNWHLTENDDGDVFYHNSVSGQRSTQRPKSSSSSRSPLNSSDQL